MTSQLALRVLIPHLTVRSGKAAAEIWPLGPRSTSGSMLTTACGSSIAI
jgi:hypothetical protein